MPGTMTTFCVLNTKKKNSLKIMSLAAYTSKTTNWRNWKLSSQNVMAIKILYPKHYSTPVCQYTSVFPENNVEDKVNKTPKVVPVGCIGLWKHNGVLSEFGKIRKIRKMCHVMSLDEQVTCMLMIEFIVVNGCKDGGDLVLIYRHVVTFVAQFG